MHGPDPQAPLSSFAGAEELGGSTGRRPGLPCHCAQVGLHWLQADGGFAVNQAELRRVWACVPPRAGHPQDKGCLGLARDFLSHSRTFLPSWENLGPNLETQSRCKQA